MNCYLNCCSSLCVLDGNYRSTVTVYRISGVMASGNSRPKADQSGIRFRNQLQVPWNAPESIVILDLLGVVALDTSAVPDVISLREHNDSAEPTQVLPGRTQNSVWVFIPDDRAASRGFHDVTHVDITGANGLLSPRRT